MLNTNLPYEKLSAFTSTYVFIAMLGYLWSSLSCIIGDTKGCLPYDG